MKLALPRFSRRGYTLTELALAMMLGMAVAMMLLAIFNQQLAFLRIFHAQNFLTTEAPILNNYMSRVLGSAEGYQLYRSVDARTLGERPVMVDENDDPVPVLVLKFKEPNGTFRYSMLSFEGPTGDLERGLYFRHIRDDQTVGEPEWALTKRADDVDFFIRQGVLQVRIIGPHGEEITYSGTQQL